MASERMLSKLHRQRKYAGFFDWPERRIKEIGIVQRLSDALGLSGEPSYIEIAAQDSDPPDCVAETEDNQRVAVEVTELVDEDMARSTQNRIGPHRVWTPLEVILRLQEIIDAKDLKSFGLSQYTRVLLLVHTDEVSIQSYAGDDVRNALQEHRFGKPKHIDEVIFLVSYDPRLGTYPYVRLTLG